MNKMKTEQKFLINRAEYDTEKEINDLISKGWRVITMIAIPTGSSLMYEGKIVVLLERETI
jgi:hypothetical protein